MSAEYHTNCGALVEQGVEAHGPKIFRCADGHRFDKDEITRVEDES